ncbi:MAG TPA: hypothetical protein VM223_18025 [Planctomycetota bacterium]|nr:hypothetical protein [Planctomycetota bacterium]
MPMLVGALAGQVVDAEAAGAILPELSCRSPSWRARARRWLRSSRWAGVMCGYGS